jgi:hypothetical protein
VRGSKVYGRPAPCRLCCHPYLQPLGYVPWQPQASPHFVAILSWRSQHFSAYHLHQTKCWADHGSSGTSVGIQILGLFLLAVCDANVAASEIHGTVISKAGTPVSAALVSSLPWDEIRTDAEGRFLLTRPHAMVRFSARGYLPVTWAVSRLPQVIVLEPATSGPWSPPMCPVAPQTKALDIGARMRFKRPDKAKVLRSQDIDYQMLVVRYRGDELRFGSGPHWSSGLPGESDLGGSQALEERDVLMPEGDSAGEYRATLADGARWRFVGVFGTTVSYTARSSESAAYFDGILDSLCWVAR